MNRKRHQLASRIANRMERPGRVLLPAEFDELLDGTSNALVDLEIAGDIQVGGERLQVRASNDVDLDDDSDVDDELELPWWN